MSRHFAFVGTVFSIALWVLLAAMLLDIRNGYQQLGLVAPALTLGVFGVAYIGTVISVALWRGRLP